jgi:molybdopterin synthase sulfur carrier subunit
MNYRVLYFASLRDRAGMDMEQVNSLAIDARALYTELQARHGFTLSEERLRVAVNGAFARWEQNLHEGDEVVFLPPVSGG